MVCLSVSLALRLLVFCVRFAVVRPSVHSKDPDAARGVTVVSERGGQKDGSFVSCGVQTNADVERMVAD